MIICCNLAQILGSKSAGIVCNTIPIGILRSLMFVVDSSFWTLRLTLLVTDGVSLWESFNC